MREQNDAAGDRTVIWHVAEAPVAEWFRNYAKANNLKNIVIVHTPAPAFDPDKLRRKAAASSRPDPEAP